MKRRIMQWACACALCLTAGCANSGGTAVFTQEFGQETGQQADALHIAQEETQEPQTQAATEPIPPAKIVVDISGAVREPGVYELLEGARVRDAVEMAGGLLDEAAPASLNQAAYLQDAQKIVVYTKEEAALVQPAAQGGAQAQEGDLGGKVNIKVADEAALCTLSGIGASRARDIIAYREANGAFGRIEDIMLVNGIKEATFSRIRDQITVG